MKGCPVSAYTKDEETGIVRHLDDQCIGCKYCTLTCPYEVPQYNDSLGIVRKCDMCTDRLSVGEAPACVQGCPNGAITIQIVSTRGAADPGPLLPGEPTALAPSHLTRPTTRYVSRSGRVDSIRPVDRERVEPAEAHWPLAVLLIGIQASVGLHLATLASLTTGLGGGVWQLLSLAAFATAGIGQAAAIFHLGRPQYAFRALLGLRTSWMSREIATLGAYFGSLGLFLAATLVAPLLVGEDALVWVTPAVLPLGLATLALGVAGIFTSVMIYVVTGRPLWSFAATASRFFGTALLLGATGALALGSALGSLSTVAALGLAALAGGVGWWKVTGEAGAIRAMSASPLAALNRSALLLEGALSERVRARRGILAAAAGALSLSLVLMWLGAPVWSVAPVAFAGWAACVASELIERNLFFSAEAARGMPGR